MRDETGKFQPAFTKTQNRIGPFALTRLAGMPACYAAAGSKCPVVVVFRPAKNLLSRSESRLSKPAAAWITPSLLVYLHTFRSGNSTVTSCRLNVSSHPTRYAAQQGKSTALPREFELAIIADCGSRNSCTRPETMMVRLAIVHPAGRTHEYVLAIPRLHHAHLAAVVETDVTAAQRIGAELGMGAVASTLGELLKAHASTFDAVLIHGPTPQQCDMVCQAAEAGKHVLADTPLAESVEQAQRAIRACRAAGVCLMVGQPLRFMPYQQAVRESLDAGKLGVPGLLRIHHWNAGADCEDGRNLVDAVSELTIREVDLACWLFDAAPDIVYSTAFSLDKPNRGVQLHLGFPAGGMALIDCSRALQPGSDSYYALTLIGSKGAAYADDHHNTNLLLRERYEGAEGRAGE